MDLSIDAEIGLDLWQVADLHFFEQESAGYLDATLDQLLEIVDVAQLAGLGDAFAIMESFPAIITNGVIGCIGESAIQHVTTDERSCPSFTSVAMNHDYVLLISRKVFEDLYARLD